jgi:hypothetical protein
MSLPVAGITLDEFRNIFLESGDFSEPMRMVQDTRDQGPDHGDTAFPKYHGLFAGFRVWVGSSEQPVWRVVDVRWVFPSAEKAEAYHLERLKPNSEGHPPVPKAVTVGEQSYVFGGTRPNPLLHDMLMTAYYYIFRVHNVVVKLFVAQGTNVVDTQLTMETVAKIALRIESRINERAY